MGNCLSKRRESSPPRRMVPLLAIPIAPQTISTPLQTVSDPPQTIPTQLEARSPSSQTLSTLPHGQTGGLNAPNSSLVPANLSMFSNADNINIKGGSYSNIVNVNAGHGLLASLDVLHKRVAPHAILNAGGRADEVRCHPGTREEVIDRIEKWADALDDSVAPIFWLSGPAGAGKSAIVQTIAERCKQRKVPQANFFFFRADTSRSDASPLIPTLLYQILLVYPSLKNSMAALLSDDPFILSSALDDQIEQLIVAPLSSIQQSSLPRRPLLLLIDGLDECDSESKRSQGQILRAFDIVLKRHHGSWPFRLLVASRDESQIQAAFNRISSPCSHLYLDDQYYPENDIQVFVNDKFTELKETHPLAYALSTAWPLAEDVDYIVKKSSGHFIYPATVMRFILDSSASPRLSLERVKGAAKLATNSMSPFSHLDAIYIYILTQVEDQEAAKDILHSQLLLTRLDTFDGRVFASGTAPSKAPLLKLLSLFNPRYTEDIVLSCFANLTPIAKHLPDAPQLLFYHASFSDFLLDQSRSGDYFVDVAAFNCKISPLVWAGVQNQDLIDTVWQTVGILSLLELQTFPPGLLNMLASSNQGWRNICDQPKPPIFNIIHEQCTTDSDINYFKYIIHQWIDSFSSPENIAVSNIKDIPFAYRYYAMACATKLFKAPDIEMLAALCPASDFDHHESAVWLNNLLHDLHKHVYPTDPEQYDQLLEAWIPWANENGIPYNGLENLPNAEKYIKQGCGDE